MRITVMNKTIGIFKSLNAAVVINSLKIRANVIQKIETLKQIHLKKIMYFYSHKTKKNNCSKTHGEARYHLL